jgi:hypothetical protein
MPCHAAQTVTAHESLRSCVVSPSRIALYTPACPAAPCAAACADSREDARCCKCLSVRAWRAVHIAGAVEVLEASGFTKARCTIQSDLRACIMACVPSAAATTLGTHM